MLSSQTSQVLYARLASVVTVAFTFVFISVVSLQANAETSTNIHVIFGADVPSKLQTRVPQLLKSVRGAQVSVGTPDQQVLALPAGSVVFAFGNNGITRKFIAAKEAIGAEAFVVRTRNENGVVFVLADGNPAENERTSIAQNRGLEFGIYEALQRVGFRFPNPFKPVVPQKLRLTNFKDVIEKPRWAKRGLHLHTMHPIELTHVLNGWGEGGPKDAAGFEKLVGEWELFCEWMIANRQNQVQWVLLADKTATDFSDSSERMQRLKKLVGISHAWGLLTGIDVGVVFEQQNMWRLLRTQGSPASEAAEIKTRLRWLMQAGWDFLTFEMGSTEFTAPDEDKMLSWMNIVTAEIEDSYNRPAAVKIHVSGGQTAKRFKDPQTGKPLNFNFLPYYADKRLIVHPHTVQIYSLKDPAPTYGNQNFSEIERFVGMTLGQRPVMFYPEAAYWVSYDVDVPLFLPVYAERRVSDLRILARKEDSLGRGRMDGQILFSSGFEWGYWLANVVAMRAAWNPHLEAANDLDAFRAILNEIYDPALTGANEVTNLLVQTAKEQHDLLILGKVGNYKPANIDRKSGIAYLAGTETWDEINTTLNDVFGMSHAATQPHRLGFRALRRGLIFGQSVSYAKEVRPLLQAMSSRFMDLGNQMVRLANRKDIEPTIWGDIVEFAHGGQINAMRSLQVYALYDSVAAPSMGQSQEWAKSRLAEARKALDFAMNTVAAREKSFSVNANRIAGWNKNPTAYRYGYLWTARTLFFWWRDEGIVTKNPPNECFMNVINPGEIAFANGQSNFYYEAISMIAKLPFVGSYNECIAPSTKEPNPKAMVR